MVTSRERLVEKLCDRSFEKRYGNDKRCDSIDSFVDYFSFWKETEKGTAEETRTSFHVAARTQVCRRRRASYLFRANDKGFLKGFVLALVNRTAYFDDVLAKHGMKKDRFCGLLKKAYASYRSLRTGFSTHRSVSDPLEILLGSVSNDATEANPRQSDDAKNGQPEKRDANGNLAEEIEEKSEEDAENEETGEKTNGEGAEQTDDPIEAYRSFVLASFPPGLGPDFWKCF